MMIQRTGLVRWLTAIVCVEFVIILMMVVKPDSIQRITIYKRISDSIARELNNQHYLESLKLEYLKTHYQSCQRSVVREKNIDCRRLVNGEIRVSPIPRNTSRTCNLTKITENCDLFRQINGYDNKVITQEEKDFPLAFGIRLHRSPEQVEQTLRIAYRPHNFYCLHVDTLTSALVYEALKSVEKCFDNVVVLSKVRTIYSSIRLVEADLLCMKEAMKAPIKWKYYLNMAGEEMPLKSNLEIVRICQLLNGHNDIAGVSSNALLESRMNYHHKLNNYRPVNTYVKKRPFNESVVFRKGSAYGMFSSEFVNFVLNSNIAKNLYQYLSDTDAPEETFISTLNFLPQAPGGSKANINHRLRTFLSRAMIWHWDKIKCHGRYRHAICIFHNAALPWLLQQPEVIINKVMTGYDQIVIDCLEEYLQEKARYGDLSKFNYTMYRKIPHISTTELNKYIKK